MTFTECHIQLKRLQRGKMKVAVGIIKEVDKLGRIVIPKDLRVRYGLEKSAELVATESGIILRNPKYKLVKVDKD